MSTEEVQRNENGSDPAGDDNPRRKRRRRRRNRRAGEAPPPEQASPRRPSWNKGEDAAVNLAPSGRVVKKRMPYRLPESAPASREGRRRRMSRSEVDLLAAYFEKAPLELVNNLYRGMGGQPDRVANRDRMIQLTVRAVAQGSRLGGLVKSLHQRDRQALAILIQCGGLAQYEELHGEFTLSLGGNDREWRKVMANLCDRGLVAASDERDGLFFYVVPDPLVDVLLEQLSEDIVLPSFDHEDVRVIDPRPFCPPLDFSITTLATYIHQHPPRLTQRQEIFKVHKDEMDEFFAQLWAPDSELFSFHIEFLMLHGMVELRGDRLSVNHSVVEEWLQLDPQDQRDLIFAALENRFPHAEWVLWAVSGAAEAWVPERPLQALYRRWRRGEDWRERFRKDTWASPRTAERESYSFTPLVSSGMLELGQWGQEKFYRLSPRARRLLFPEGEDGFSQFYLTPNFEIMAPAGMAPILFFRIGELAELTSCDRANTYKITQVTVEQALERDWRREDIFEFLRDNSQIGLPENVEETLRGWMGHRGDVELHQATLISVHRSQIRRLETNRHLRPFLVHRFAPGLYAVDPSRLDELKEALEKATFSASPNIRRYPDDPQAIESRERLLRLVAESRDDRIDLVAMDQAADSEPETLHLVPGSGSRASKKRKRKNDLPQRCSPREVRDLVEQAVNASKNLKMLYVARDETRKLLTVTPERLALTPGGEQVLVARDVTTGARLSYQVVQIERMDVVGA